MIYLKKFIVMEGDAQWSAPCEDVCGNRDASEQCGRCWTSDQQSGSNPVPPSRD